MEDYKFYPFSIILKINPSTFSYFDIPKIVIQVDEFIVGSTEVAKNERIYDFFEVWLPHDSNIVEFDWQSSVASLYVCLGGRRPTSINADFKLLSPGRDTILSLSKEEIIDRAKIKGIKFPYENSLEDLNLVIGIWTNKTDSIDSELYSLRVHQPRLVAEDSLDIVLVNTDQKILCNPKQFSSNEYRCLFVVTYDDKDVNMLTPLLAYGASINKRALSYMYANYIDRNIYDEYIENDLKGQIPEYKKSSIDSRADGVEYIYLFQSITKRKIYVY